MICVSQKSLSYPLDPEQLYWLQSPPSGPAFYSAASFYFASSDSSRLVPALADEERFITALTSEIASLAGFSCVPGLQALLDELTADNTPPAPRYPSVGDTNVLGCVVRVFDAPGFLIQQSPTPPPGWTPPPLPAPQVWVPTWSGIVRADLAANGYDTPPATLVEAWSDEIGQFVFQFRSTTAVRCGACTFTISQGQNAPIATDVVNT
jgi:hypothetical protein